MRLGAYDFIEKPLSLDKLLLCLGNALSRRQLEEENRLLREKVGSEASAMLSALITRPCAASQTSHT